MKRPGHLRRAAAAVGVAAALLGLSGCFRASEDVKVRPDGTGSVVFHIEFNKKALAALTDRLTGGGGLGGSTPTVTDLFRPVDRTLPDGSKVRAVDGVDQATVDASFDFDGSADYKRKLHEINQAVAAEPDTAQSEDGSIQISRAGDRMDVELDTGSSTGDIDLSMLSGVLNRDSLPRFVVTITMPGSILASNGTARGRTVSWDMLSQGAPPTLQVSSTVNSDGLPSWALPVGAGLIFVLLLAILGVLVGKRRRGAGPVSPAGTDPTGPHPPGPWSPTGQPGTGTFFPAPVPPSAPPPWTTLVCPQVPSDPPSQVPTGWSSPAVAPQSGGPPWADPATVELPGPPAPPLGKAPEGAAPEPAATGPLPWRVPGGSADPDPVVPSWSAEAAEPTAPPTVSLPAVTPDPGWYADPAGGPGLRYWDGRQWTAHTH